MGQGIVSELIRPALTAEEWARYSRPNGDFILPEPERWGDTDAGASMSRHGMAALCLHGQPEGFNHEMVRAVLICIEWANAAGVGYGPDEQHRALARDAADRIAALLPDSE